MTQTASAGGNPGPWTLSSVASLAEISRAEWDSCAFPDSTQKAADSKPQALESTSETTDSICEEDRHNPFISHDFLSALEDSDCVGGRTGWLPQHQVLRDGDGALLAVVPCYLKLHSQGEYVFDHGWADAFVRAGGSYYPKLQIAVPFTPATGPRLLVRAGVDRDAAEAALTSAMPGLLAKTGASSLHATFLPERQARVFEAAGWLIRNDRQFHWHNQGYASFEDFLAALASRKRKAIRRERAEALLPGITIEWVTGTDLTEAHWDAFFEFYMDTGSRKWGSPYLTRRFFSLISARMPEQILLIMARREGRLIAGALNLIGERTLYGRNWGAIEHHPFLHFEVCYYQAIDFAIAHGLARVEAGAQGEHKLARGYVPATTWSAHEIAHGGLRRAVADYLARERAEVAHIDAELLDLAPFRKHS